MLDVGKSLKTSSERLANFSKFTKIKFLHRFYSGISTTFKYLLIKECLPLAASLVYTIIFQNKIYNKIDSYFFC